MELAPFSLKIRGITQDSQINKKMAEGVGFAPEAARAAECLNSAATPT